MSRFQHDVALTPSDVDYALIAELIPEIVWIAAREGSTVYFNRLGTEYTGQPREPNDDWNWLASIHPDDADRAARAWLDALARERPYEIQYRMRRYDGVFRWHECRALPVRDGDGDGEIVYWIWVATDVDDGRRLETSLRATERRSAESLSLLETLQSSAPLGLGFVDLDLRLVHINDALAATTGAPREQQLGRALPDVIPALWPELGPICRRALETGEPAVNRETSGELPGDPGYVRTWLTSFYPVRLEQEVIGIGIVVVDITECKEMQRELKHLSEHDSLTGIYNRPRFVIELDRSLRYAARYEHGGAVLMLDVDNFKWTNNSYGHATGDQQLRTIAQLLLGRLRETDIVGRIGGDEFAVVLPEVTEEQALTVAMQLRTLLCARPVGPPVYASIGIALFSASERLIADEVLIGADMAMYQAKEAGGDQAAVYNGRSVELMERVKDLRKALTEQRFVLHAQPIIDLRSGQLVYRELLIRMLSDTGEVIAPKDFLPIAERFSLVGEIDRWVVGQALTRARTEPVTVNLSGPSVGDPRILAAVREAIDAGLDPSNLIFEITETAVMTDFPRARAFVDALDELGCDLALDDFGTGFGSFTYLKHLPARYLKLDMEFVRDVNTDPTDKAIIRSIVEIAHTIGKQTIAEGVESADVQQTLCELGVDYAQGFHIGRPEPLDLPIPAPAHAA